jgi:hypothetical protein
MHLKAIEVESYAGVKADETPRRFALNEHTIEVDEVLDRWYQSESRPEWPRADYFKVRDVDGSEYLLKHDLESDEWFLGQRW